jgi:hypothetical protein
MKITKSYCSPMPPSGRVYSSPGRPGPAGWPKPPRHAQSASSVRSPRSGVKLGAAPAGSMVHQRKRGSQNIQPHSSRYTPLHRHLDENGGRWVLTEAVVGAVET